MSAAAANPLDVQASALERKPDQPQKRENKQYGLKFVGAAISSVFHFHFGPTPGISCAENLVPRHDCFWS